MNFWLHWFQRQTSARGVSIESASGGETCALDEVLPPLLLALVLVAVPELPLALVVDDASAGDADLSRLGDRAWTASGTWADIFRRLLSGGAVERKKGLPEAAEILSGRGHRRSGAGWAEFSVEVEQRCSFHEAKRVLFQNSPGDGKRVTTLER